MSDLKKNEKSNIDTEEVLQQLLLNLNKGLGPEQLALLQLSLEEKTLAKKERDEKKANEEAFRKSRLEAVEVERQAREFNQNACNHRKENGRPCIGGQRDHNGHYMFLCMNCMKQWVDGELPMTLRIPMEYVGGPV